MDGNPADRLIVALDLPAPEAGEVASRLMREVGVYWFKVSTATLLEFSGRTLINNLLEDDAKIFLDLKVYDIPSTVERVVRAASAMGAEMLTVHVDCAYEATRVENRPKILAVGTLTSSSGPDGPYFSTGVHGDGLVCHPRSAGYHRSFHPNKLIVCPGIRPREPLDGNPFAADDHVAPATPAEAVRAGADYLVVGRPITRADDPVVAARAVLEEMRGA